MNRIESPEEIMVKKLHQVTSAISNSTTEVILWWVHKKLHFYSDATRKFRSFSNMQDPHCLINKNGQFSYSNYLIWWIQAIRHEIEPKINLDCLGIVYEIVGQAYSHSYRIVLAFFREKTNIVFLHFASLKILWNSWKEICE